MGEGGSDSLSRSVMGGEGVSLSVKVCDAIGCNVCHACDTFTTMSLVSVRSLCKPLLPIIEDPGSFIIEGGGQTSTLILEDFLSVRVSQNYCLNVCHVCDHSLIKLLSRL